MDKRWMQYDRGNPAYQQGILDFIQFVHDHGDGKLLHLCPCIKCFNTKAMTIADMYDHLNTRGIMRSYTTWYKYGELADHDPTLEEIQAGYFQQTGSSSGSFGPYVEPAMNILHDTFPSFAPRIEEETICNTAAILDTDFSNYDNQDYETYTRLLASAQTPLFEGSPKTVLETIISQVQLKVNSRWSNESFDKMLKSWKPMLPPRNLLPDSYYKCKKILKGLGLGYNKIHACKNNCMLFYKDDIELNNCRICRESRWEECSSTKTRVPVKVLRHFPLILRLQRLYMSSHTSKNMRWHGEERKDDDTLRHPADGEAWKSIDRTFPDFAADVRNVRLGLATDGFNPFGNMNLSHSTWPVIAVSYNLPPWMCMKKEFSMLCLLIPGPTSPGKCLDVFLQPLIDELQKLWANGVCTFDRHSGTLFIMRAMAIWTISDFPGYGMLSSQTTKGYYACPICLDDVHSDWHAGKVCYLGYRRWLPADHPWRQDELKFDKTIELRHKPRVWSGDEILEKLNSFDFGKLSGDSRVPTPERPDDLLCWSHKSIFFSLPYWSKLILMYNFDVMHIEKNVSDAIMGTTMNLKGKNKDTEKARHDLQRIGIRKELWPKKVGSTTKYPIAPYTIKPASKKNVFVWFKGVKYPHGYAGNIARCIKVANNRMFGLKTHDSHVLLQRLLPVVIRPYLPDNVVEPLIALSRFFQKLCAKELKKSDVLSLKEDIVYIMCKLEMIFPPAFFDNMIHLMIHLPEQVLLSGPVHCTWMFPQERQLGRYKSYVNNYSSPEGSIAESYIAQEAVTYCSLYLHNNDEASSSTVASSTRHSNLSFVSDAVQTFGKLPNSERLSDVEIIEAHWCVLQHSEEAQYFLNEHLKLMKQNPRNRRPEEKHKREFPNYFFELVGQLQRENSDWYYPALHHLAGKPTRHSVRAGCFVNGVKFVTLYRDCNRKTQNYGVMVDGDEFSYYGVLLAVVELIYGDGIPVVLFKCKWFNTDPSVPGSTKMDHGLLSVNTNTSWYDDEPFILATMVKQVFYLNDPKAGGGWKVVNVMSHRNIWSASTLEGVEEEAYQEPSASHIPDIGDIRTNNEFNFVQLNEFIDPEDEDDSDAPEELFSDDEEANDTEDEDYV